MNFGVIGPGDIGAVIVQKLRDVGYPVKMANSRGPESLKDLAAKTGAIPVSLQQVVQDVDMLFLVVPQRTIPELPKGLLNRARKDTIVIDVGNYYPFRDGRIDELENGLTESVILSTVASVGNVAVAPNGDVLAVWSFHTNNTTTPIETQAAFSSGGHWGNTITVTANGSATASSDLAHLVGLGFDGNSNATLVWEQLLGGSSCAPVAVTGNSSSGFGSHQVLGNTCLGWVQLAVTSNGQALAVQGGATLGVAPVIATSRGSNGVWSAPIDVANPYYGRQRPWVGLGNNGTAAVVWRARTFGEYAVRENGVWSAPAELPQGGGSVYPEVAVDGGGNAVAAYSGKVSFRPAGGTFQTPITLGSGEVVASPGGTFVVSGTAVATLLPGSTTWNQSGPSSGLVAIAPGEAIAIVNPPISVATESVP